MCYLKKRRDIARDRTSLNKNSLRGYARGCCNPHKSKEIMVSAFNVLVTHIGNLDIHTLASGRLREIYVNACVIFYVFFVVAGCAHAQGLVTSLIRIYKYARWTATRVLLRSKSIQISKYYQTKTVVSLLLE